MWFDETPAIILLDTIELKGLSDTYPRSAFETFSLSAPFVATLVDVTGLVIDFTVASMILQGTLR